jgi:hypothetical protein
MKNLNTELQHIQLSFKNYQTNLRFQQFKWLNYINIKISFVAVEFSELKMSLFKLNFSTNQLVFQLHDDPVLDFLPFRGNVFPPLIILLHQNFQSGNLSLTFLVKLLFVFLLLDKLP